MSTDRTRVNPSEAPEIDDEALESVAGGCQIGCSNDRSCTDFTTLDPKCLGDITNTPIWTAD